jgi:uridine kinase
LVTKIIAITGPSGSGKTHLAQALQEELHSPSGNISTEILAEDSYYHDQADTPLEQRESVNYDHPSALEHELMLRHLRDLKSGASVDVPHYDYTRHTRSEQTRLLQPTTLLIVEGILLLSHSQLRQHFDLRLFVDTPLDLCLSRRMRRDCEERGRSRESVLEQFETTVRPMFHRFIEPTREHAHMVLSGDEEATAMAARIRKELEKRGVLPEAAE